MNKNKFVFLKSILFLTGAALLITGCQSEKTNSNRVTPSTPKPAPMTSEPAPAPAAPTEASVTPANSAPMRINAGATEATTNKSGQSWMADSGFSGGDVLERADLTITNTSNQEIYRTEHYAMDSFTWPVANGKYLVKLHFCETYEGITGPGERVFSFNVQGKQFDDFDVWAKAGGPYKAYVESVPVEVTNGKLLITFGFKVENPQINGIEIIPQP